jgi:hypothetical protein
MSADFSWNEAAAEQIRSECETAMKQQASSMENTISSYNNIAATQGSLAAEQEHIAATAMTTEEYTKSDGSTGTRSVPDWPRREIAAIKAKD